MRGWKSFGNLFSLLLFAILLISSQVAAARNLPQNSYSPVTGRTGNRKKPICDGKGPYNSCIGRKRPIHEKCDPYRRNCPPSAAHLPQP